jgi:hypothetical protein
MNDENENLITTQESVQESIQSNGQRSNKEFRISNKRGLLRSAKGNQSQNT